MYNKILKNYQINVGIPFQVKTADCSKIMKQMQDPDAFDNTIIDVTACTIENAKTEAEYIIKEAELEAQRIIEKAELEAEKRSEEIMEEAEKRGFEAGIHEAEEQYRTLLADAENIKNAAYEECKRALDSIEEEAVELVLKIARAVIAEEVSINKDNLLLMIRNAFNRSSNKENAILKVSSDDYEFIVNNKEKILAMTEGTGELEIRKEYNLQQGSCIIETQYGTIDAGLNTKMSKIEDAFLNIVTR